MTDLNKNKIEIKEVNKSVIYMTQPSPVVLVSTISKDGINNLAPFGYFMNCSSNPPMLALGLSPKSDTYKNIIDTKEFVVSIPNEDIIKQVYKCGNKYEPQEDEFKITGLTPYKTNNIKASRVMECSVNIDCVLENYVESGNHYIVVGKVVGVDIEESIYSEDKVSSRLNVPRMYHITRNKFLIDNEFKEVEE